MAGNSSIALSIVFVLGLGPGVWGPTMKPQKLGAHAVADDRVAHVTRVAMLDVFRKRHAVRAYQSRPVPPEVVADILDAANSAPSAGGLKAREIRVVTDAETRRRLAVAAHGQTFVGQAPVVLVFWAVPSRSAAQYGERGRDLFALQDASIATSFAWIQAVGSGLGACWVGAFDDDAVNEIFRGKIGRDWRPIALLPIGYPAE